MFELSTFSIPKFQISRIPNSRIFKLSNSQPPLFSNLRILEFPSFRAFEFFEIFEISLESKLELVIGRGS